MGVARETAFGDLRTDAGGGEEGGYPGPTGAHELGEVDEIADRIGATKGAVYYSNRSKIEIFLALYERGMLILEERVADALASCAEATAAERLAAVCIAHADNIMRNFAYHVVIQSGVEHRRQMALKDADRTRLADLDRMRSNHESLIQALVEDGQRDGSIRNLPARLAARTLLVGIAPSDEWRRQDRPA